MKYSPGDWIEILPIFDWGSTTYKYTGTCTYIIVDPDPYFNPAVSSEPEYLCAYELPNNIRR